MTDHAMPDDARRVMRALRRATAKVRSQNLAVGLSAHAREKALYWLQRHGVADWVPDPSCGGRLWFLTRNGRELADQIPATTATGAPPERPLHGVKTNRKTLSAGARRAEITVAAIWSNIPAAKDVGDFYANSATAARALREAIEAEKATANDRDALAYLKRALESAEYVGD